MELLDRYLEEIRPLLPKEQRLDILAELSEDIRSQLEDREAELGRPLTKPEQEAVLDQYGPPIVVAGRYRPNEGTFTFGKRVLIGPELFPFYMKALRIVGGITGVAVLAISAGLSIWKPSALSGIVSSLFYWLALQFSIQTVVWTSLHSYYAKHPNKWNPPKAKPTKDSPLSIRLESVLQIGIVAVIFPWIHSALWPQHVEFAYGELAPVWHALYVPVVALMAFQVVQGTINLLRPSWLTFRAISRVVVSAAWLGLVCYLLASGPWLILVDRSGNLAEHLKGVAAVNRYVFFYGLLGTAVGAAIQFVFDISRLFVRLQEGAKNAAA